MSNKLIFTIALLVATVSPAVASARITQADKDRAAELVSKMTLEEKCRLISGKVDGFHTAAIERLGIPSVRLADGPQGVRNNTKSTYYPCGLSIAASWNREAAFKVGEGIGNDARARGVGIMLCPGVNIYRNAQCGRNFEYMGEDPFLASETAIQYIKGIQSRGVMSTIKHFAVNNQEYERNKVSTSVDERSFNEIYTMTFRKAVEQADVACVMTSYNAINGTHAAENTSLVQNFLREAWGFDGIVMSDWVSTYSTIGTVESGLDLEMPRDFVTNYKVISELVRNGVVNEALLDDKCCHILQSFSAYGFLDAPVKDPSIPENYGPSREAAYKMACEAPVLLKNDGTLPLAGGSVVVTGPNADFIAFGGGSGAMSPIEGTTTTLYEGLCGLGKKYKVSLIPENCTETTPVADMAKALSEAALQKSSVIIVAAGFDKRTEGEGFDRTYSLPKGQNELIEAAIATGKKVVVVINSGGEVDITPWADRVSAIIMAWYGGQEGGKALADIISGKVSPSGRLPFTFWGTLEKNPTTAWYGVFKDLYGTDRRKRYESYPYTVYKEGIFGGYRGVKHFGIEPMYPFGYGLTYSSFSYGTNIECTEVEGGFDVTFTVTNTGKRTASEVAQVYVGPVDMQKPVLRAERLLRGYEKVTLAKGESRRITIRVPASAFSYYDVLSHDWVAAHGEYNVFVGASSADTPLSCRLTF